MARTTVDRYVCRECGAESAKWLGKCPVCGAWNSYGVLREPLRSTSAGTSATVTPVSINEAVSTPSAVMPTGDAELDRVLGGGLTPGGLFLLAGEPGIGKSTLLMMLAGSQSSRGPVAYVSGEETANQIARRAQRLGSSAESLKILATQSIEGMAAAVTALAPVLVIVDSIQTVGLEALPNALGSVAQIREATLELGRLARSLLVPIVIVGHVTKDGDVAGPKVLEHLVDAVLVMEGDRQHDLRLLRTVKNRFGPTDEVGVFTMDESGLLPVTNPSARFLEERATSIPGSAVVATVEGTRALLVEVQALVQPTQFGYPKRTASGFDNNRLQLLLAVLEQRAGVPAGRYDVYINVIGGIALKEPAADLAICLAVASAIRQVAVPARLVVWGEVGLSGEIRSASQATKRTNESKRLGYEPLPTKKTLAELLTIALPRRATSKR